MYNSIMYDIFQVLILPKVACRVLMHMHFCDKHQPTTVACGTDIDNGKSGTVPDVLEHLEGMGQHLGLRQTPL